MTDNQKDLSDFKSFIKDFFTQLLPVLIIFFLIGLAGAAAVTTVICLIIKTIFAK